MVAAKKLTKKTAKKRVAAAEGKRSTIDTKHPNATVAMDRRDKVSAERRAAADRRIRHEPVAVERRALQRRAKVNRRRQIDPTTCERDYTSEEIEFMSALDDYKRSSGRMFPTCSEVLEVFKKLGYEKRPAPLPNTTLESQPAVDSVTLEATAS